MYGISLILEPLVFTKISKRIFSPMASKDRFLIKSFLIAKKPELESFTFSPNKNFGSVLASLLINFL